MTLNTEQFIPKVSRGDTLEFSVTWQSPSNIALIKYWGKSNPQIPKNASISFTLEHCHTITSIHFVKKHQASDSINFELYFKGKKKGDFKPKIATFFDRIIAYCPYILEYEMTIRTENSFPHSSGIASSASGMSAIALCIMSLEKKLYPDTTEEFFKKKASFLARLGSGSAGRSVEGPLVVWGRHFEIDESSDLYGIRFKEDIHPIFKNYQDTILLVDKGEKLVSSTLGHQLMLNHPFAQQRFQQANKNLSKLAVALQGGDIVSFINIVESEALALHAMMLTSNPYFILMKPNTLHIINTIWKYRKAHDSAVCFTLDAGANVHLLYPEKEKEKILQFIDNQLSKYCYKNQYLCDNTGLGAIKI